MTETNDTDDEETIVYSPKQAAACLLIGTPLLYISTYLSGWLEWIVGIPGAVAISGFAIWAALVITNTLALAIEGETLDEILTE